MQQTKGFDGNTQTKEFQTIKIGFLRQGTSFSEFCKRNGIDRRNAIRALKKKRNGKKAQALRKRLTQASKGEG